MLLLDLLIKIFNFHINQVHPIDVLISVGRFRGIIVSLFRLGLSRMLQCKVCQPL